ncbi:MAG: TetR/AcrR family transcriptional regulator [Bacillota bacterium]
MSTTERRERARQELRQAILAAALELAREGGWGAVTIRQLAQRVEYSPPAIYEYFASKEAILNGLIEEGFARLHQGLVDSATAEQPRERILQAADAHWEFAMENPALYRAMYGLDGMPFRAGESLAAEGEIFAFLREAVARHRQEPVVVSAQPTGLDGDVEILLATVHGLIATALAGRTVGGPERVHRLLKRAVRTLLDQWGA